jgi:hypothetical protein
VHDTTLIPSEQQRLDFMRWLVATGDVDEGDSEPPVICIRCRRPMVLSAAQVALVAQSLPIVHRCGQPQIVGAA